MPRIYMQATEFGKIIFYKCNFGVNGIICLYIERVE